MDGQKRIWMQQAELLDRHLFRVSWILDPDSELRAGRDYGPLAAQLRLLRPPPRLVASPLSGLPLPLQDLRQHPPLPHWRGVPQEQFGAFLAAELRTEADYDVLYRFAHDRLRQSNFSLELLTPRWCRVIYEAVADLLRGQRCHVLVLGNSRGFSSNVILTDTARLLAALGEVGGEMGAAHGPPLPAKVGALLWDMDGVLLDVSQVFMIAILWR
jgi:hypothetical protein